MMAQTQRRIAMNAGGGFVPGLDLVATGAVRAADRLGWEVLAIRDRYDMKRAAIQRKRRAMTIRHVPSGYGGISSTSAASSTGSLPLQTRRRE